MIAYLIKHWKLLLDIVIIVAAIILFTLFDPFGMFSKRNLNDTANLVSSIKDIGELVTAEYYGEVIGSLNETLVYDIPVDSVSDEFEECFYSLKDAIVDAKNYSNLKKSEKYTELKTSYTKNNIYNHLIAFLAVEFFDFKVNKVIPNNQLEPKYEKQVIKKLFALVKKIEEQAKKENLPDEEKDIVLESFKLEKPEYLSQVAAFHYQLNDMSLSKGDRRRDIVFIGRGWVKAGFRFDQLNERNFYYDKEHKLIRFYGLAPVVLDKDINPWFVPEQKIKGFELVHYYKNAEFEEAKKVKIRCKQKLFDQASEAGIMDRAQENGEEALKNLFSLLLNEPDLTVEFEAIPYKKELNLFIADTLITVDEALKINNIINELNKKIKESISPRREEFQQQLQIFYNQLKGQYFVDTTCHFSLFSIEAAKILNHKFFVTQEDFDGMVKIRGSLQLAKGKRQDTIYTSFTKNAPFLPGYPDFVPLFNQTMICIDSTINRALRNSRSIEFSHKAWEELDSAKKANYNAFYNRIDTTPSEYLLERKETPAFKFSHLMYPEYSVPEEIDKISTDSLASYIRGSISERMYKITGSNLNYKRKIELENIIIPYEINRIKHKRIVQPLHKFVETVQNL